MWNTFLIYALVTLGGKALDFTLEIKVKRCPLQYLVPHHWNVLSKILSIWFLQLHLPIQKFQRWPFRLIILDPKYRRTKRLEVELFWFQATKSTIQKKYGTATQITFKVSQRWKFWTKISYNKSKKRWTKAYCRTKSVTFTEISIFRHQEVLMWFI